MNFNFERFIAVLAFILQLSNVILVITDYVAPEKSIIIAAILAAIQAFTNSVAAAPKKPKRANRIKPQQLKL